MQVDSNGEASSGKQVVLVLCREKLFYPDVARFFKPFSLASRKRLFSSLDTHLSFAASPPAREPLFYHDKLHVISAWAKTGVLWPAKHESNR